MILADVMNEVADRVRTIPSLAGRVAEWPLGSLGGSPYAILTYPEGIAPDQTYGRGVDRITGPMLIVAVSRPNDRATREVVSRYTAGDGPESVLSAVNGDGDYTSCDSVNVSGIGFDADRIGDVDYLLAIFTLDIWGPGALSS